MNLLVAFYGDDFTGSTDAMEVLQWAGLRTVLFLAPPTRVQLEHFQGLRAFGIAGWSRTMSPAEMDVELAPALECLRDSGAPLVHYKICSTFDSSPEVGSIGRALEIGRRVTGGGCVPVLVGAPMLGRYTVFGNLFARSGLDSEPFRLDRHPTMQRHPVTPMTEADLRLHLARQTSLPVSLFDVLCLDAAAPGDQWEALLAGNPPAVLVDVLYHSHLATIGQLIARGLDSARPRFVVGSSGVEYAMTAYWEQAGHLAALRSHDAGRPTFAAVDQLIVVTGSCSPVNDRQIASAEQHGYVGVPIDAARLVCPATREAAIQDTLMRALTVVARGGSPILHACRGPDDPRVQETRAALAGLGLTDAEVTLHSARVLGPLLGRILDGLLARVPVGRVVVTGGDTSGYVARALGIDALEAIAPAAPGSPLCRMHSGNALDGLEVVFKGGQVGHPEIYDTIRKGTTAA
jgi:3-oxoisoapionate kinase